MSKTKHNPPRKAKPGFIKFSKVQRSYLNEVINRQRTEFNEAVNTVYEELGITDQILKAPPGTYILKQDFSGMEVHPIKPGSGKKGEKPPEDPPSGISKGGGRKDN